MDDLNWMLLAFAAVITGAGFVQSCLGFGYGVFALACLPYFMDIRLANLALSLSILAPSMMAVWAYRQHVEWQKLSWSVGGALLFLPAGLLTFAYLPVDALARGTGLVILIIALQSFWPREDRDIEKASPWHIAAMGAISGYLAGAIGIGGPPIAAYAVRQPWTPNRLRGFLLSFLVLLSAIKAFGIVAVGWVDQTVLMFAVVAVPFALLGSHFGIIASRRLKANHVRNAVLCMLIIVSAGMILRGSSTSVAVETEGNSLVRSDAVAVRLHGARRIGE